MDELKIRLESIGQMADAELRSGAPILLSTAILLEKIKDIAMGLDREEPIVEPIPVASHVIISCDASIKNNPGGPAAIGYVIQDRDKAPFVNAQLVPATTSNQAEYDAVYIALSTFCTLNNNPGCKVEIVSDSLLVIQQLRGEINCNDETLNKKRGIILELVAALPFPVEFSWRPRNSTPGLESANYSAQDALGVPRH